VISVAAGSGPAKLFLCRLRVKYMYVKTGTKNADAMIAACVVAESGGAIFRA